jgi:hypothetical protein
MRDDGSSAVAPQGGERREGEEESQPDTFGKEKQKASKAEKKRESASESDRNYIKVKQRGTQRWETHRRRNGESKG